MFCFQFDEGSVVNNGYLGSLVSVNEYEKSDLPHKDAISQSLRAETSLSKILQVSTQKILQMGTQKTLQRPPYLRYCR